MFPELFFVACIIAGAYLATIILRFLHTHRRILWWKHVAVVLGIAVVGYAIQPPGPPLNTPADVGIVLGLGIFSLVVAGVFFLGFVLSGLWRYISPNLNL